MAAPRPHMQRRWPVVAVVGAILLFLAWYEGGEAPLRPIAQAVDLPETQP